MTSVWVLDSSVVLKWFLQGEILGDQALALRQGFLEGRMHIVVPTLLLYEVANVLRYKTALTTEQIRQTVDSLFNMDLAWVSPTVAVMQRTVALARAYDTSVYDATFAALAEAINAQFVTADARLVERLEPLPYVHFLGELPSG
jgi:predicted nucleic acid-binding protein